MSNVFEGMEKDEMVLDNVRYLCGNIDPMWLEPNDSYTFVELENDVIKLTWTDLEALRNADMTAVSLYEDYVVPVEQQAHRVFWFTGTV
ncbi:hypothetical protein AT251_16790 [Enterovibrio nigricans]|nr:hypothetical protein [Enterovibrio nigricans]PKF49728.1 hypothetical protein AT251_16790 [Enterovibrio nigricans]